MRYIPASYRTHISLHIPGTYSCIIPLGQSYRCQMGLHTMTLNHIPGTYLCSIFVRHIPTSHPWHISPHIPGTYSCIIPQGQSYPCQMGHQCFPPFKVKKRLATPVDCTSQGLNFIGTPVLCYLNRSFFFLTGKIAAGNLNLYLPFLLKEIQANPKRQYLLLHSLKEVCTSQVFRSG